MVQPLGASTSCERPEWVFGMAPSFGAGFGAAFGAIVRYGLWRNVWRHLTARTLGAALPFSVSVRHGITGIGKEGKMAELQIKPGTKLQVAFDVPMGQKTDFNMGHV